MRGLSWQPSSQPPFLHRARGQSSIISVRKGGMKRAVTTARTLLRMRGNQSGRSSERSFEWPDELLEAQRFQIGRNMMPLLLGFPRWVHRRVETIEFVHETRVRRSVSLDFTIPGFALPRLQTPAGERILVPLALLN